MSSVTIPDSVTYVGNWSFVYMSLTSLTIPASVTGLGSYSFSNNDDLTTVTLPNGATIIGDHEFADCTTLTSVNIPDSVTIIDEGAFTQCSDLRSVMIPSGVSNVDASAFSICPKLMAINVGPNNQNYISDNGVLLTKSGTVLVACPNGISSPYVIPDGVTTIASGAFTYCQDLPSVIMPDSMTSIGMGAFYGCSDLSSITIPSSVTYIGNWSFAYDYGLTRMVFNGSAPQIGGDWLDYSNPGITVYYLSSASGFTDPWNGVPTMALSGATGNLQYLVESGTSIKIIGCYGTMDELTVPSSISNLPVTSIGDEAFCGCPMSSISIPYSVMDIGNYTFVGCTSLEAINVDEGDQCYASMDGVLYNKTMTTLLAFPGGRIGNFSIPSSVTNIWHGAFEGCSLCNVTIPKSVGDIGLGAFYGCDRLTSIVIGNNLTSLGGSAFQDCTSLRSVSTGNGVIQIGDGAFDGCTSLTLVLFGNNVTFIGNGTFHECTSLSSISPWTATSPT